MPHVFETSQTVLDAVMKVPNTLRANELIGLQATLSTDLVGEYAYRVFVSVLGASESTYMCKGSTSERRCGRVR